MERPCPNCGTPVGGDARLCARCGAALPPRSQPPTPPYVPAPDVPTPEPLLTSSSGGDKALGVAAGLFLIPALLFVGGALSTLAGRYGVPETFGAAWLPAVVLVPVVTWARLRPRYPVFARAFGGTLLGILVAVSALVFGALLLCTGAVLTEGLKH